MHLKKIDIFGFKSFADKTTMEFSKGVSAIVGPNGSGKSNIVDALRWVLGEQGDRALRSEKREDVVFNGTRNRKPLSVAEVSLTIVNDKNILPTEFAEVQIARRFFRSGETEYYLNGTKVRLKDIKHLFAGTGIGPDAYSVIELKMTEVILSSVKNERRKMFEEASGIVTYKQNRDATLLRLNSVHETLSRVSDIIREKQRNVNSLERQVKRNEEAKRVSEELRQLELLVFNFDYHKLNSEIEYIKAHEKENIELKEKLETEIKANDALIDELRSNIQESEASLSEMTNLREERRKEIEFLERENIKLNERLNSTNENIKRLTDEILNTKASISKNEARKIEKTEKVNILKEAFQVSEHALREKKEKVDSLRIVINENKAKVSSVTSQLKEVNASIHSKQDEHNKLNLRLENNFEKLTKLTNSNEENILQIKSFEEEKSILTNKLSKEKESLKNLELRQRDMEIQKAELETEKMKLEEELKNENLEYNKLKTKIDYFSGLSESLEDYSEGIKYLTKELEHPNISTIANLIEVDDKYRIAVETALGEVANYLVVDDSRDINKLINLLVNNRKGKITFILNDKINYNNFYYTEYFGDPEFIKDKGIIGFADKFVKCADKKHELLIKYILDEYIIVESLDIGMKYAKDNYYKFITLDGDIITDSVIRAGSETNPDIIRLGRDKSIENMQTRLDTIKQKMENAEESVAQINSKIDELKLDDIAMNISAYNKSVDQLSNEMAQLNFKIDELNKTITKNEDDYKQISGENKHLQQQVTGVLTELNESNDAHKILEEKAVKLAEEVNDIQNVYNDATNDYNEYNLSVIGSKKELEYEEENLIRITSTIENQTELIAKNESAMESGMQELAELNQTIKSNTDKIKELNSDFEIVEKDYRKLKSEYEAKREEMNVTDIQQRDRRTKFDKVSFYLIDSNTKIATNKANASSLSRFIHGKYEVDLPLSDEIINNEIKNNEFLEILNEDIDIEKFKKRIDNLTETLKKLGGYQQLLFEDFDKEKAELENLITQKNDLLDSEKDILKAIEKINQEARERFLMTFEKIRENFIMIFKELFQEGDEADLKLVYEMDEDGKLESDPLEAKIEISAKPRGKRPTSIELLSGGEKTLTAIALLFAIYLVKPSPFCVLDEVDAPLDPNNLGRFNNMIRRFSENTQFILITHNERTMETVDRLYGVTMQEAGVTTIVETKFKNKVA
ncbi:MAG TPA: chromosome segregation protein SMC [Ignavibacteria bacterium]|nr:chromosome segregation protein SMC [Ignavibacteria bacterium]